MDTELFELCKEVSELTGWNDKDELTFYLRHHKPNGMIVRVSQAEFDYDSDRFRNSTTAKQFREENETYPLYTSDYLLEKLPGKLDNKYLTLTLWEYKWLACYMNGNFHEGMNRDEVSETPLKALLNLTLALHEAGELKPTERLSK
jgi:hypothetical protein